MESIQFEPLTFVNLDRASDIAGKCFAHDQSEDKPTDWFRASLDKSQRKNLERKARYPIGDFMRYWVADYRQKIVGTTGLYATPADEHEALWVGWFCLSPDVRGKGFGNRMLEFTIDQAREQGAAILRLYTSDLPEEEAAQHLYNRHKLHIVRTEKAPGGHHQLLYRERAL